MKKSVKVETKKPRVATREQLVAVAAGDGKQGQIEIITTDGASRL